MQFHLMTPNVWPLIRIHGPLYGPNCSTAKELGIRWSLTFAFISFSSRFIFIQKGFRDDRFKIIASPFSTKSWCIGNISLHWRPTVCWNSRYKKFLSKMVRSVSNSDSQFSGKKLHSSVYFFPVASSQISNVHHFRSLTLIRVFLGPSPSVFSGKKIQDHRWWRHSWDLENENYMCR